MTAPENSPEAKCPYAQVAGMASGELAASMQEIAEQVKRLINSDAGKKALRHPSLMRESRNFPMEMTQISEDDLPPLPKALGRIHVIFRRQITKELASLLDEEALQPETRQLMRAFGDKCNEYKSLVRETGDEKAWNPVRRLPDYRRLEDDPQLRERRNAIEKELMTIQTRLELSELATAKTITLKQADGTTRQVENDHKLGLYLFALGRAVRSLNDSNKIPDSTQKFLTGLVGIETKILAAWGRKLGTAHLDSAYRKAYPQIVAEIRGVQKELQIERLCGTAGAWGLLEAVHLPIEVERIETREEFYRVAHYLAPSRSIASLAPALALIKAAGPYWERGFNAKRLEEFEAALKTLKDDDATYPDTKRVCGLLHGYVEGHKQDILSRSSAVRRAADWIQLSLGRRSR